MFKHSESDDEREIHELEVWMKMVTGRRRIYITARVVQNPEDDQEYYVYRTVLQDIKDYLHSQSISIDDFLHIPVHFKIIKKIYLKEGLHLKRLGRSPTQKK